MNVGERYLTYDTLRSIHKRGERWKWNHLHFGEQSRQTGAFVSCERVSELNIVRFVLKSTRATTNAK